MVPGLFTLPLAFRRFIIVLRVKRLRSIEGSCDTSVSGPTLNLVVGTQARAATIHAKQDDSSMCVHTGMLESGYQAKVAHSGFPSAYTAQRGLHENSPEIGRWGGGS